MCSIDTHEDMSLSHPRITWAQDSEEKPMCYYHSASLAKKLAPLCILHIHSIAISIALSQLYILGFSPGTKRLSPRPSDQKIYIQNPNGGVRVRGEKNQKQGNNPVPYMDAPRREWSPAERMASSRPHSTHASACV